MRVLVQRVSRAEVRVESRVVGAIGRGVLLLVGFTHSDADVHLVWMADKVIGLRIFPDDEGKMNRSIADIGGSMLVVSQFTLYGDARQGRRPAFTGALEPVAAKALYEQSIAAIRAAGVAKVEAGEFAADMKVDLLNDGPVTILLDSRKLF